MNSFVTDAVLSATEAMKLVLKPALPAGSSNLEGRKLTCKRTLWWGRQDEWHENYGSSEHRWGFFSEGKLEGVREGFVEELGLQGYHRKVMGGRQVIKQKITWNSRLGWKSSNYASVCRPIHAPAIHYSIHLSVHPFIHPSIELLVC